MRVCPQCHTRYPDQTAVCPEDGTELRTVSSPSAAPNPVARHQPTSPDDWHGRSPSKPGRPAGRSAAGQSGQSRRSSRTGPPAGADQSSDQLDLIGRTFFGEYTITGKLGQGGMGAVYLARQNAIDQNVALKVLHARAAESNEIVQRFHREAKVISMLTHPNIVRVFIFGRTPDDLLYLVMEFVEGRELRDRLDRAGPLDELLAIKIMKQACSALAEAHDLGIIHRDLKPDNLLLTNFRGDKHFVKILDFGIAKLNQPTGQPEQKLTQAGIVYGTPEYLSPEQAQALDLDHRTDIYSLGCILYEMITGQVPFKDDNPVKTLNKHVFEEPRLPNDVADDTVAVTMEAIITKAMAKNPDQRYTDAMDMFEALVGREREIVAQRSVDARDTYFPGSELTGMHQVSKLHDYLDAANQTGQGSSASPLQADGGQAPAGPADASGRDNSGNPKVIFIAIGVLVFILVVLIGFIALILING